MYQNELAPRVISMGYSYDEFWHMNPRIIDVLVKADNLKKKERDRENWYLGQYMLSAIATAFDKNTKYIEKPILEEYYETLNMSQEEYDDMQLKKMIASEEAWIKNDRLRGLEETQA